MTHYTSYLKTDVCINIHMFMHIYIYIHKLAYLQRYMEVHILLSSFNSLSSLYV